MLELDHLTLIAPNLAEGVAHVRDCLGLDVPFGTRHAYMGTHNHRLQLGHRTYLEIVALDPDGADPGRPRWFGLDDQDAVRAHWAAGRRLRGWVARTEAIQTVLARHGDVFGNEVSLPPDRPEFGFSLPPDGSLPFMGAAPSLIDHRDAPTDMAEIPDMGARLQSFAIYHPDPEAIRTLYDDLDPDRPPTIMTGPALRYTAQIETPGGLKTLT